MKIRILPILLFMGFLMFGLTQTDSTQANAVRTNNPIVAANNQSDFTPALATTTPFFTTPNITNTTGEARTPGISVSPTITATISPSATSLNAAMNIEKGASSIGPAFEKFLQEAGATAPTPDNLEAAEVDIVEDISQPVAASQTQVESDYGKFDLSRLRIVNLLPATDRVASVDGASAAKTVNVSSQLQLGSSGVIPDDTAKILAAETDAPKLWPVKGPVTSTFGPRQTLRYQPQPTAQMAKVALHQP